MDWEVVVTQVMVMMGQVEKVIVGVRKSETDVFYRLSKMVVIGYFLMFYKQHLNTIYRKIIISFFYYYKFNFLHYFAKKKFISLKNQQTTTI